MIRYRASDTPPHIIVEAEGKVSGSEVRRELSTLRRDVEALEPGFVVLAVYPDLVLLKAGAVGPLFYYIARIFDNDPGLFLLVDGGQSPHPGLRSFVTTLGLHDQVRFAATRDEADAIIQAFQNDDE